MLGNILRPRRSRATSSPGFQSDPTGSQPTAAKTPSKFLGKLKGIKKLLRSGPLSKKKPNVAGYETENRDHRLAPSGEILPASTPTPSTALNYEYRRAPPTLPHQYFGPSFFLMHNVPRTRVASNPPRLAPPSGFSLSASAPLAPATHTPPRLQHPVSSFQNVAEVVGVKSGLAELGNIEQDPIREELPEVKVKVSKQPKSVILHTAPFVQSYAAEVEWCQPASPGANAPTENKKTPQAERSGWLHASGDLQQSRLYWAKRVREYREGQGGSNQVQPDSMQAKLARPRAPHPVINTPHRPLVREEVAEQAHGLQRSQGIPRNRQPHARHSSKPSQDSNMAVENEPIFRYDHLSIGMESQGVHPPFASQAQGPRPWPTEKSNDERSLPQAPTPQATPATARVPLGLLDQNVELNAGAPVSTQAAADDDDDDDTDDASSSSYDHAVRTWAPEPSLWLGQNRLQ